MKIQYGKHYSHCLGREMEYKIYGHGGKPVLFIPCQAGRFFDFENFKMTDTWAPWIESGRVTVYSIDTIDGETWADKGGDPRRRIERHEQWYNYVVEEMVPLIRHLSGDQGITTFGCSMGAMHAANFFFRRPDLFDQVLALSGLYDSRDSFGDYMDDLIYQNSPCDFLTGMDLNHPYIQMYNERKIIICVGQGAWEDELRVSTAWLDRVVREKGIRAWIDFWGFDVNHDWNWWYRQVEYFVPYLLGDR